MPYKAAIVSAIEHLKDHHTGSSLSSIRKHVQASLPSDARWNDTLFLTSIKAAVESGDLVQVNKTSHYKLSTEFMRRRAEEMKEKTQLLEQQRVALAMMKKQPSPKESPKKKPEKAKVKLTNAKIITVVTEGRKTERMDMSPIREGSSLENDEKTLPHKKTAASKTKLIPRKVLVKKMMSDPMKLT